MTGSGMPLPPLKKTSDECLPGAGQSDTLGTTEVNETSIKDREVSKEVLEINTKITMEVKQVPKEVLRVTMEVTTFANKVSKVTVQEILFTMEVEREFTMAMQSKAFN